jgi:serine/threonine protein kinase
MAMEPPPKRQRREGPLNIKVEVPQIVGSFGMPVDDHYQEEHNGVRMGIQTVYKSIWFPDDNACQAHAVRLRSLASLRSGVPRVLYMQRRGSNLIYVQAKIANAQSPAKWSMSRHQSECLCDQIATILEQAHGLGLYHRDLKPSNILVTKTNKAYLIDWDHQDDLAGDLTWGEDAGADPDTVADLKALRTNSADFDLGTLAMLRDYWLPTSTVPSYIG